MVDNGETIFCTLCGDEQSVEEYEQGERLLCKGCEQRPDVKEKDLILRTSSRGRGRGSYWIKVY